MSELKTLPGVMREQRGPGDAQYDRLVADVQARGYTHENPVFVMVNHKGEAYLNEGNTRVAVADARRRSEPRSDELTGS